MLLMNYTLDRMAEEDKLSSEEKTHGQDTGRPETDVELSGLQVHFEAPFQSNSKHVKPKVGFDFEI